LATRGAGSSEPLSRDTTDDARALNRRVEVWVTPRGPVAKVTRVVRRVESREAAAPEWRPARTDLELRRFAKVRTLKQSASEVTFQEKDRVSLGPSALVVIYDSPAVTATKKRELADVEIEKGSVFASLAAKEGRTLAVGTKSGRIEVESKRTRIDVSKSRKQSAVSVYEGRSTVSAKGKAVSVIEGFGTRVREGQAPEEPRPLPLAPEWQTPSPKVVFAGEPLELAWTEAPGTDRVEVQIAEVHDRAGEHPFRMWRVRGGKTTGGRARAGAYWLRLVAMDERSVAGVPGRPLSLVSLAPPQHPGQEPAPVTRGVAHAKWPGLLELPVPPGLRLRVGTTSSTRSITLTALRPGLTELPLEVATATGAPIARTVLRLRVPTSTLTLVSSEVIDASHVRVKVRVRSGRDHAVDALELVAGDVPAASSRLVASATIAAVLRECFCEVPKTAAAMTERSGAEYEAIVALSDEALARAVDGRVPIRIYERRAGLATELFVAAPAVPRRGEGRSSGVQAGLHFGSLVDGDDAPRFYGALELGLRLGFAERFTLDAGAEAGLRRRWIDGVKVDVVPIVFRAAVGATFGAPRIYAGGGVGLRFAGDDAGTGAALLGLAGAAYAYRHFELGVEARYEAHGTHRDVDLGGVGLGVVLRAGTWDVVGD
ncbi:FecR domain-containing protein, partial [Myxococcota bacterium]|nr:FecR domain-containing protein [Myxococcota bacterium]